MIPSLCQITPTTLSASGKSHWTSLAVRASPISVTDAKIADPSDIESSDDRAVIIDKNGVQGGRAGVVQQPKRGEITGQGLFIDETGPCAGKLLERSKRVAVTLVEVGVIITCESPVGFRQKPDAIGINAEVIGDQHHISRPWLFK